MNDPIITITGEFEWRGKHYAQKIEIPLSIASEEVLSLVERAKITFENIKNP
jgi:hypothetical protein